MSRTSGEAAFPGFGATAGTAAQGSDTRITGAAQKASNLTDLASPSAARTALGLGTAATSNLVGGLPSVPAPALGVTIDVEGRAATVLLITRLVAAGVITAV